MLTRLVRNLTERARQLNILSCHVLPCVRLQNHPKVSEMKFFVKLRNFYWWSQLYRFSHDSKDKQSSSGIVAADCGGSHHRTGSLFLHEVSRITAYAQYVLLLHVAANYFRRWIFYAKSLIFRQYWYYFTNGCDRNHIQRSDDRWVVWWGERQHITLRLKFF